MLHSNQMIMRFEWVGKYLCCKANGLGYSSGTTNNKYILTISNPIPNPSTRSGMNSQPNKREITVTAITTIDTGRNNFPTDVKGIGTNPDICFLGIAQLSRQTETIYIYTWNYTT